MRIAEPATSDSSIGAAAGPSILRTAGALVAAVVLAGGVAVVVDVVAVDLPSEPLDPPIVGPELAA